MSLVIHSLFVYTNTCLCFGERYHLLLQACVVPFNAATSHDLERGKTLVTLAKRPFL